MKIDVRGFFLGGFLGLLILVLLGAVIGFVATAILLSSGGELEAMAVKDINPFYALSIVGVLAAALGNYASGYLVAKLSAANRLSTAMAVGIVGTILAVVPFGSYEEITALSLIISAAVPLPLHYIGASSFIKRTIKSKEENARVAGLAAQKDARSF